MLQYNFPTFRPIPPPPLAPMAAAGDTGGAGVAGLAKPTPPQVSFRRSHRFTRRIIAHGGPARDTSLDAATRAKRLEQLHFDKKVEPLEGLMAEWSTLASEIATMTKELVENQTAMATQFQQHYAAQSIQCFLRSSVARWKLLILKTTRFLSSWVKFKRYFRRRRRAAAYLRKILHRYYVQMMFYRVIFMNRAAATIQSVYIRRRKNRKLFSCIQLLLLLKRTKDHVLLFGLTRATRRIAIVRAPFIYNPPSPVVRLVRNMMRHRRLRYLRSAHGKLAFYILSQFYGDQTFQVNVVMDYIRRKVISANQLVTTSTAAAQKPMSRRSRIAYRPIARQTRSPVQDSGGYIFGPQHLPSVLQGAYRPRSIYEMWVLVKDLCTVAAQHPDYLEDGTPPNPSLLLTQALTSKKIAHRKSRQPQTSSGLSTGATSPNKAAHASPESSAKPSLASSSSRRRVSSKTRATATARKPSPNGMTKPRGPSSSSTTTTAEGDMREGQTTSPSLAPTRLVRVPSAHSRASSAGQTRPSQTSSPTSSATTRSGTEPDRDSPSEGDEASDASQASRRSGYPRASSFQSRHHAIHEGEEDDEDQASQSSGSTSSHSSGRSSADSRSVQTRPTVSTARPSPASSRRPSVSGDRQTTGRGTGLRGGGRARASPACTPSPSSSPSVSGGTTPTLPRRRMSASQASVSGERPAAAALLVKARAQSERGLGGHPRASSSRARALTSEAKAEPEMETEAAGSRGSKGSDLSEEPAPRLPVTSRQPSFALAIRQISEVSALTVGSLEEEEEEEGEREREGVCGAETEPGLLSPLLPPASCPSPPPPLLAVAGVTTGTVWAREEARGEADGPRGSSEGPRRDDLRDSRVGPVLHDESPFRLLSSTASSAFSPLAGDTRGDSLTYSCTLSACIVREESPGLSAPSDPPRHLPEIWILPQDGLDDDSAEEFVNLDLAWLASTTRAMTPADDLSDDLDDGLDDWNLPDDILQKYAGR